MLTDATSDAHGQTFDVVFVCTGNRARSPLAEAFLTGLVDVRRVTVRSRGTLNAEGRPALPEAVAAGARLGVDLSGHRSASIEGGELASADLVVGFEPFHVASAVMDGGSPRSRAFTIRELVEILDRLDEDDLLPAWPDPATVVVKANGVRRGPVLSAPALQDPFGASQKEFDRVAATIDCLVATLARRLFGATDRA